MLHVGKPTTSITLSQINVVSVSNTILAITLERRRQKVDHEVVTASSGLSALTLAAVFRPELVLLDIAMPGQNGYATAQRIQQLSVPRRPYIVAVTGWATQNHKRRSARAGFDLHLTKPVDGETHQTLAALVLTSNSVEERYRVFSAQQRAIATELILQQLEMANTYLETAVDTIDDSVKVSLTAHASRAHERISTCVSPPEDMDVGRLIRVLHQRLANKRWLRRG